MYLLLLTGGAAGILVMDLLLKQYVEETMQMGEEKCIPGGKLCLRRVHNSGLFLNLLEKKRQAAKWLSAGAFAVYMLWGLQAICRKGQWLRKAGLFCLAGGALSNLYDRFVRGYVVDYAGIRCRSKKLEQITFNLGDICIFIGAVVTALTVGKKAAKK